ncbi:IDEAL domain-containing protein [Oceanobacillus sp. 1P07AA]|uniref:IDEAL domain-containing protein n=1 Tax=Oceanobacillus sp. 1P07AA TaxID=3132293 RepID=UPI0039A4E5ED
MVTVKMLKPYYVKTEEKFVRIILAYQYFSVMMNKKVYQFIPVEANEIRIDRKTKRIVNTDAVFAFQNGKDIITISMSQLISIPEFLEQLHGIAESYYLTEASTSITDQQKEVHRIIKELELNNIKRLIDKALDQNDYDMFIKLSSLL